MKLSILNAYILSMLDRGRQTPYDLHRRAAISLGASLPALRELTKERLATRAVTRKSGKRTRHEYSLTGAGRDAARTAWMPYLDSDPKTLDLDSLLRVTDMALYYGGNQEKILALINAGAKHRRALATKAEAETEGLGGQAQHLYSTMRAACDARRFEAEAEALAELAKKLSARKDRRKSRGLPAGQQEFDIPSANHGP